MGTNAGAQDGKVGRGQCWQLEVVLPALPSMAGIWDPSQGTEDLKLCPRYLSWLWVEQRYPRPQLMARLRRHHPKPRAKPRDTVETRLGGVSGEAEQAWGQGQGPWGQTGRQSRRSWPGGVLGSDPWESCVWLLFHLGGLSFPTGNSTPALPPGYTSSLPAFPCFIFSL